MVDFVLNNLKSLKRIFSKIVWMSVLLPLNFPKKIRPDIHKTVYGEAQPIDWLVFSFLLFCFYSM